MTTETLQLKRHSWYLLFTSVCIFNAIIEFNSFHLGTKTDIKVFPLVCFISMLALGLVSFYRYVTKKPL
jgi:hypothetical protein